MKIGLLVIATNKYVSFLQPLISSADKYFMKDHEVTYFVFSDQNPSIISTNSVVITNVTHKPWPWMTLGRYQIFTDNSQLFENMDYLYYCDVDMLFWNSVGSEILSNLVATQHPGYYGRRGTPETNPISTACVYPNEKMQYFAGGFNGGSKQSYLSMAKTISNNIKIDLSRNYIAIWHDESHMNRYFIDNAPTKILDPGYCFVENYGLPFIKRLESVHKNNSELHR